MTLHTTALLGIHEAQGATLVPFAGWRMPLRYGSDLEEHAAVRTGAGLFDLSHMAQVEVSGPRSGEFLDGALVGVSSVLRPGRAKYNMITDAEGRVLDDLIVYRLAEAEYHLVANAANRERVVDALTARSLATGTQVIDHTLSRAMVAIQGPRSAAILAETCDADLTGLKYYAITLAAVAGAPALVARTGYTGEDGFEVIVGDVAGPAVWDALLAAGRDQGLVPCGLAARDTLRLEAGMPLYGHELSEDISPFEAGLGRVVNLGHDFVGRDALAKRASEPLSRRLVGLVGRGRRAARAGSRVLLGGVDVGAVTSGVLSPTLGHPIALALVATWSAEPGTSVEADVRGKPLPMKVTTPPFYTRQT
ncbi:MAG: glycine cleavage system aminomethyltransferase GcvT [Actinomycetota bacterium]